MLNHDDLALALDLHRRSYRLLLWLSDRARNRSELANVLHETTSEHDAAFEWLSRLYGCLPLDTRPEIRHLPAYAGFFSTYLRTSFEPQTASHRTYSPCGCYCSFCTYVIYAPMLKARPVGRRDKKRSVRLMEDRLVELAYEDGVRPPGSSLNAILDDPACRLAAAWSTYGRWLIRRCDGQSPGPALLALWKVLKSDPDRSHPRSQSLFLEDFVRAEEQLVMAIGEHARSAF